MRNALGLGLATLIAITAGALAFAQEPSARDRCVTQCGTQHARDRGEREECELRCPPPDGLTPVAQCRFRCGQESRLCDRSCASEPDEGERRGCLRRCGSRHVSCPQQCEHEAARRPPT